MFIAYDYAKKHRLKTDSATGNVFMSSSSLNSPLEGLWTVRINLLGETYTNTRFSVLDNLCCDAILGQNFMGKHSEVSFAFGGIKNSLHILLLAVCHQLH